MSSDTLRGIGQKGSSGDSSGQRPTAAKAPERSTDDRNRDAGESSSEKAEGKPAAASQGLRSLDSTVPGTRSLDANVPGATPPPDARLPDARLPDAKLPNLAATLMGMA